MRAFTIWLTLGRTPGRGSTVWFHLSIARELASLYCERTSRRTIFKFLSCCLSHRSASRSLLSHLNRPSHSFRARDLIMWEWPSGISIELAQITKPSVFRFCQAGISRGAPRTIRRTSLPRTSAPSRFRCFSSSMCPTPMITESVQINLISPTTSSGCARSGSACTLWSCWGARCLQWLWRFRASARLACSVQVPPCGAPTNTCHWSELTSLPTGAFLDTTNVSSLNHRPPCFCNTCCVASRYVRPVVTVSSRSSSIWFT